ncbi:hypothetical protein NSA19_01030 [Actinomyces bowdenii]|uniref:hypothetical protein n=1 Tax=Actinomyces bowdenii TaxID=131109 RepID=UPI00214D11BF|nr:hypothetical protein [Actinomyces bowdenii]MCR2051460.1 hypothetical protein [Actinomyces bowdenii]
MTTNNETTPYTTTYGKLQDGDIYVARPDDGGWADPVKYLEGRKDYLPDTMVVVLSNSVWPTDRMIRVIKGTENYREMRGEICICDGNSYDSVTSGRCIEQDYRADMIEEYEEVIPISAALLERVIREGEPCQYCDDCPTMGTHTVMAELRKAIEKWRKEGK